MIRPLLSAAAVLLLTALSACGDDGARVATADLERADQRLSGAQADPGVALAPGTLSQIADVPEAHARLGYVNVEAVAALRAPLAAPEITRLVLGPGAARLAGVAARRPVTTATQVGPVTLLDAGSAQERTVVGGTSALRQRLRSRRPASSLITPETQSAVQSCLGDAAAAMIAGPALMGRKAAFGAGLRDTTEAPAGPKLLLCAAPHYVRDLARIERRLQERFGDDDAPAARRPVIGETDIGERDIVQAVIPLAGVSAGELRGLLSGGPALLRLAGR
jgi:hypothetical protein